MSETRRRRNPRLDHYDYTAPGHYFVTVCAKNRAEVFGQVVGADALIGPTVRLSSLGEIVKRYLLRMPGIDQFVIMPNHVHFIVAIPSGPMRASAPTGGLPSLVRSWKALVTKEYGAPVWQRGYYDHILRDEEDWLRIRNYMEQNPARWAEDEYFCTAERRRPFHG